MPRLLPSVTRTAALLAAAACWLPASGQAADETSLARSKNCLACHTLHNRVIGPSFQSIARQYRNQPGAAEIMAAKILKGGSGAFGAVPMPASPQVSQDEALRLAQWILQMR